MSAIPIPHAVEDALVKWAEAVLIERGAKVIWPEAPAEIEFVTPMAFYLTLTPSISEGTFRSRLQSPGCPRFIAKRSEGGRLLMLQPTDALRAFMKPR